MPSTTLRSFEATSPGYESAEELELKPHKAKVVVQKRSLKELVSQNHLPPSPADGDSTDDQTPTGNTMEQRRITRDITRGSPGDEAISPHTKSPEQRQLAKKRSQYYEDAFAYREPQSSARERVSRESMIMADVRTNVIVGGLCFSHEAVLTGRRYKTNIHLLRIFRTPSRPDINDPSQAFLSRSPTQHVCCSVAPSILRTR